MTGAPTRTWRSEKDANDSCAPTRKWETFSRHSIAIWFSICASTAWEMSGSGVAKWEGTAGARRVIWGSTRSQQLPGFYSIGLSNAQHWKYAQPGQWNDPDYILIGWVGAAQGQTVGHPTTLTGNEQYSYMSMWCLMAAPLIFSGDMEKLDEFTLNVLCNAEVIDVDQDALGKQARIVRYVEDDDLVLAKPMEDGSLAVGLFNLGEEPRRLSVSWEELGLRGPQRTRDLWRQQDIECRRRALSRPQCPPRRVSLVRLWPNRKACCRLAVTSLDLRVQRTTRPEPEPCMSASTSWRDEKLKSPEDGVGQARGGHGKADRVGRIGTSARKSERRSDRRQTRRRLPRGPQCSGFRRDDRRSQPVARSTLADVAAQYSMPPQLLWDAERLSRNVIAT